MKQQVFEISHVLPVYGLFISEDVSGYFYFLRFMVDDNEEFLNLISDFERITKRFISDLDNAHYEYSFQEIAIFLPIMVSPNREKTVKFFALVMSINEYLCYKFPVFQKLRDNEFEDEEDLKEYIHVIIRFLGFFINIQPIPRQELKNYMGSNLILTLSDVDLIYEDNKLALEDVYQQKTTFN